MLEIKTISGGKKDAFDKAVNDALRDGWDLVRRDCLIVGSEHTPCLYAELERIIEESEEEEDSTADTVAVWVLSRDPHYPYKCSACGCKSHQPIINCPNCNRLMEVKQ